MTTFMTVAEDVLLIPLALLDSEHSHLVVSLNEGLQHKEKPHQWLIGVVSVHKH